jgi:hypothetical protein
MLQNLDNNQTKKILSYDINSLGRRGYSHNFLQLFLSQTWSNYKKTICLNIFFLPVSGEGIWTLKLSNKSQFFNQWAQLGNGSIRLGINYSVSNEMKRDK